MIFHKSLLVVSLISAVTSCTAAFAAGKAPEGCKESDRATNTANYILLMKTPSLAGNVRSVQIVTTGTDKTSTTNTLTFSRCGQLEKRLFVAEIRMSDDRLAVTTSDLRYQDKGWVMEMKQDLREKGQVAGEVSNIRYFYTDKLGRISHSSADANEGQNRQIQTKWSYHYDEQHRLVQEKAESMLNKGRPQNFTEEFRYDARGRLSQISGSQRNQSFRWDEKGRWVSSEDINKINGMDRGKNITCFEWDRVGNCTAATLDVVFRRVDSDEQIHQSQSSVISQYQYWDN
ncbi:RHS repeat domain-containing protein [Klebsiella spallanzanii]|uniref:RHS repeat domain-containing protein n=1 Tax=Klebsiella spallanzanii TaxID=2587528 RepID=UPI00115775BB|nr:hypothetical protein [Klebsiella spallanzanii]VUS54770.1 hypothetical protein SB6419_00746 [Klebsiella spallanzanii]